MNDFLAGVQSESLEQLLNEVRAKTAPFGNTGASALDDLLRRTSDSGSPLSCLGRGHVLEIQGGPASGKTHLLYQLVSTCVLPVNSGGWNKAAIVYDADQTFDIKRLYQLMRRRVERQSRSQRDDIDAHAVVMTALRNLRLFPVASTIQLAASISSLPTYHAQYLPTSEIALLAIDSMSAFYWQDRFTGEKRRPRNTTRSYGHMDSADGSALHRVLVALEKIRISHGPVIVMTNWGIHADTSSPLFYRQHLPAFPELPPQSAGAYPTLTHCIALHRNMPVKLPSGSLPASMESRQADERPRSRPEVKGYVLSAGRPQIGFFTIHLNSRQVFEIGQRMEDDADVEMEEYSQNIIT
ncbi:unnamed protein product [Peniophora sp. CBMAI 1063]|nr:unnamed protein product [Peniophora sp. CBMAI 1063]